jgi:hypothetical protein
LPGFLLGLVLFPLLVFEDLPPVVAVIVGALPVIYWMYLAAGLIAWHRRPHNGVGMLLVWVGVGVWIVAIHNTAVPVLRMLNAVCPTLFAAEVHLLVAFPAGRLSSMRERMVVAGAYFAGSVLQAPHYLFDVLGSAAESVGWEPSGVFGMVQLTLATCVGMATAAVLALRLLRAWPHRSLAAVYGGGIFLMVFGPLSTWAFSFWWPERGDAEMVRDSIQMLMVAALPIMVLIAFSSGGFRRTAALEELGAWLGEAEPSRAPIRDALAKALGDPTLALAYWSAELRGWVSGEGAIISGDRGRSGRARHEIVLGGSPVAAIEFLYTRWPKPIRRNGSSLSLAFLMNLSMFDSSPIS